MIIPVARIQNVLRTYGKQLHIAQLNLEETIKTKQGQIDKVDISDDARQLLSQKNGPENADKTVENISDYDET